MRHKTVDNLVNDIRRLAEELDHACLMEVCGTHTMSLFRTGVRDMLPGHIRLLSGPGCPVCVTSQGYIDAALELARRSEVIICTYGDMMRVPGSQGSLESERAAGGAIEMVYSAYEALEKAKKNPERQVVFLAVGFETTAPATAITALQAQRQNITNLSFLTSHKLILPAMRALLSDVDHAIDGFLCPGHVSIVLGARAFEEIARDYHKPCVVAGFEPIQLLLGIRGLLSQLAEQRSAVENVYAAAVSETGNEQTQAILEDVFALQDEAWRGLGIIPKSGLGFKDAYAELDAGRRFGIILANDKPLPGCRCGDVIQGKIDPTACELFRSVCQPHHPIGPCMVSSEGTCAAWYKYHDKNSDK